VAKRPSLAARRGNAHHGRSRRDHPTVPLAPDDIVVQVLQFLRGLTDAASAERIGTAVATEPVLRRDWDTPEEDDAWANLWKPCGA
jgi:hypothetical protein